jgi:hypothetical protein
MGVSAQTDVYMDVVSGPSHDAEFHNSQMLEQFKPRQLHGSL